MIEIDNVIFFDNDDEFYTFSVVPELVQVEEIGIDGKPFRYSDFNFTSMYKDAVAQGKKFVIKDEDSKVYKNGRVSFRSITKPVKGLKPYFEDLYEDNED